MKIESWRESATYIREENTPRIHTKPKLTLTSYKVYYDKSNHYNTTYRCPYMISYEYEIKW